MPSSKYGRRPTPLPKPPICKNPLRPPLGGIPFPPPLLLTFAEGSGPDYAGGVWHISGLTRCDRDPTTGEYHGDFVRGLWHIHIRIVINTVLRTLDCELDFFCPGPPGGTAYQFDIPIPPATPIFLSIDQGWQMTSGVDNAHITIST